MSEEADWALRSQMRQRSRPFSPFHSNGELEFVLNLTGNTTKTWICAKAQTHHFQWRNNTIWDFSHWLPRKPSSIETQLRPLLSPIRQLRFRQKRAREVERRRVLQGECGRLQVRRSEGGAN